MKQGIAVAIDEMISSRPSDHYHPGALGAVAAAFEGNPDAEWVTGRCPIVHGGQRDDEAKLGSVDRAQRSAATSSTAAACPASVIGSGS